MITNYQTLIVWRYMNELMSVLTLYKSIKNLQNSKIDLDSLYNSIKTFQDGYAKQTQVNAKPLKTSTKMGVVENNEINHDGLYYWLDSSH